MISTLNGHSTHNRRHDALVLVIERISTDPFALAAPRVCTETCSIAVLMVTRMRPSTT